MSHVTVASYPTRAEAQSAARMLVATGVDALVVGDDAGGALPHLTIGVGGSEVRVPSGQQQEALELLGVDMTDPDEQVLSDPVAARRDARRRRWLQVVAAAALLLVAVGVVITLVVG